MYQARTQLKNLTVQELRDMCRDRGYSTQGKKGELLERISMSFSQAPQYAQSRTNFSGYPSYGVSSNTTYSAPVKPPSAPMTKKYAPCRHVESTWHKTGVLKCIDCSQLFHNCRFQSHSPNLPFRCPSCRIRYLDPFNEVVEFLATQRLCSTTLRISIEVGQTQSLRREGQSIWFRMIKEDDPACNMHMLWPAALKISVNNETAANIERPQHDHKRRDEPLDALMFLKAGVNHIELTVRDQTSQSLMEKPFVFAVIKTTHKSIEKLTMQVKSKPQAYEDAFKRVVALLAKSHDDEDIQCLNKDTELVMNCPISCMRLEVPTRGTHCEHVQCFDLQWFLHSQSRMKAINNRWKCPVCDKITHPDKLVVDAFVEKILNSVGEDTSEVILQKDGSWSCKVDEPLGDSSDEEEEFRPLKKARTEDCINLDSSDDEKAPEPAIPVPRVPTPVTRKFIPKSAYPIPSQPPLRMAPPPKALPKPVIMQTCFDRGMALCEKNAQGALPNRIREVYQPQATIRIDHENDSAAPFLGINQMKNLTPAISRLPPLGSKVGPSRISPGIPLGGKSTIQLLSHQIRRGDPKVPANVDWVRPLPVPPGPYGMVQDPTKSRLGMGLVRPPMSTPPMPADVIVLDSDSD